MKFPRRARCLAIFSALLLLCSRITAQQIQVTLDPTQTKIEWTLGDVLHTVHGTFKLKSGMVMYDAKSGDASGSIIVDATSGESGNHSRDKKMHKDVLESGPYPEFTFFPKHLTGGVTEQGTSNIQVEGTFRIHGADHDLTLSIPVQKNGDEIRATTSFAVPYQAWGMKNPSTLFLKVDDKVGVSLSTVGRFVAHGAPATTH